MMCSQVQYHTDTQISQHAEEEAFQALGEGIVSSFYKELHKFCKKAMMNSMDAVDSMRIFVVTLRKVRMIAQLPVNPNAKKRMALPAWRR